MTENKPLHDGDDRSRMSGDAHVRFWEGVGVKFPRATHSQKCTVLNEQVVLGQGVA